MSTRLRDHPGKAWMRGDSGGWADERLSLCGHRRGHRECHPLSSGCFGRSVAHQGHEPQYEKHDDTDDEQNPGDAREPKYGRNECNDQEDQRPVQQTRVESFFGEQRGWARHRGEMTSPDGPHLRRASSALSTRYCRIGSPWDEKGAVVARRFAATVIWFPASSQWYLRLPASRGPTSSGHGRRPADWPPSHRPSPVVARRLPAAAGRSPRAVHLPSWAEAILRFLNGLGTAPQTVSWRPLPVPVCGNRPSPIARLRLITPTSSFCSSENLLNCNDDHKKNEAQHLPGRLKETLPSGDQQTCATRRMCLHPRDYSVALSIDLPAPWISWPAPRTVWQPVSTTLPRHSTNHDQTTILRSILMCVSQSSLGYESRSATITEASTAY